MTTDAPSPALTDAFRDAFRCHPAGVAVLTAAPFGQPVALTVSSLISASAQPPQVAFSVSSSSNAGAALLQADSMVIHLLRYSDLKLAQLGSTKGADRFGPDIGWETLPTGEPRYTSVGTWFRARISGVLSLQGAKLVAAELLDGAVAPAPSTPEDESLIYLDRGWHRLRQQLDGF